MNVTSLIHRIPPKALFKSPLRAALVAVAMSLGFGSPAFAQTLTWAGSGGGNWTVTNGWLDGVTPVTWTNTTPRSNGVINSIAGTSTITVPSGSGTILLGSLTFGHTGTATVNLVSGVTFDYDGAVSVTNGGTATLSGGTHTFSPSSTLAVTNGIMNMNVAFTGVTATVSPTGSLRTNGNNQLGQTLNINGGSVLGTGNSNRVIPASTSVVVGADFTSGSTGTGNGQLSFSGTVNLGSATRAITVDAGNSGLALNGAVSGTSGVGLTKSGAGLLTLGGTNTYDGLTTVSDGELRLNTTGSGISIAGNVVVNSGLLRLNQSNKIADSSTVTMNGGTWNFQDSGGTNNRDERIQKLVVNGGTLLMAGTSNLILTQASGGVTTSTDLAVDVNLGGELAGDTGGSLNVNVVAREGGIFSPGNGTAGDTGTLGLGAGLDLSALAAADQGIFNFNLGATADRINITGGNFVGAANGGVLLNLSYTSGALPASFVLFDWTGSTVSGVDLTDFTIGSASPEFAGYFLGISGNQLTYAIPEPSSVALLAAGLGSLAFFRRRRMA